MIALKIVGAIAAWVSLGFLVLAYVDAATGEAGTASGFLGDGEALLFAAMWPPVVVMTYPDWDARYRLPRVLSPAHGCRWLSRRIREYMERGE